MQNANQPKYLSPATLGITPGEFSGLVEFVKAAPKLKHVVRAKPYSSQEDKIGRKPNCFSMEDTFAEASCGTVCCVGGYVGWIIYGSIDGAVTYVLHSKEGDSTSRPYGYSPALVDLYYPNLEDTDDGEGGCRSWNSVNPAEAARVVEHFLTTGKIDWTRMAS